MRDKLLGEFSSTLGTALLFALAVRATTTLTAEQSVVTGILSALLVVLSRRQV